MRAAGRGPTVEDDQPGPADEVALVVARSGRWWSWPLRLALSVGMVWFLVNKIAGVAFTDVLPDRDEVSLPWLGAALALTASSIVLAAVRWQQVLAAMDARRTPFGRLVSHYFAGQFVSNVLPTTIGGDVLRAARLARDTGDAAESFASLIIERLTGWLVLPLLTLSGLVLAGEVRASGHPAVVATLVAAGTLVGLVLILAAADHPRLGGRFAEREGWQRFLGAVHLGLDRFRRHPLSVVNVLLVGFAYQLIVVLSAFLAARALGLDVGPTAILAFMPAVAIAQVLPISLGGLGVREGAFVLFLHPLGVERGEAIALGLLFYGMNLAVSLLGAPSFAVGGKHPVAAA